MTRKQRLPYTRTDLLRAFRMFADPGAPSGCISPAALEKALVGVLGTACCDKHACMQRCHIFPGLLGTSSPEEGHLVLIASIDAAFTRCYWQPTGCCRCCMCIQRA